MNALCNLILGLVLFFGFATASPAQDLHGEWSGSVEQNGPGDYHSSYTARMVLSGAQGQMDYPSLGCGGTLSFLNQRDGISFYSERLTYGRDKCLDGGMIAVTPEGDSVRWAWNLSGATASGLLSGFRRLPSCNECDVNRNRCYAGCETRANLIEQEGCNNRCRAEYPCVIGHDCK